MKKTKLIITIFALLILIIAILLFPKKYEADVFLDETNLYSKITIVSFKGEKYISKSDLNNVIHINAEYEEFQKIGFKDEETGVYMKLLTAMENRHYIDKKYLIATVELFKEKYLSLDELNKKSEIDFEIKRKKLFIKTNNKDISISPSAAINVGLKALERNFEYDSSSEYDISLYETEDYIEICSQLAGATGGTVAKITKKGKLLETRIDD